MPVRDTVGELSRTCRWLARGFAGIGTTPDKATTYTAKNYPELNSPTVSSMKRNRGKNEFKQKDRNNCVGVLFLTAMVTFLLGDGLIGSILDDPDYLISVSENNTQVIIGVLIAFIDGAAIVGIAVMMFPILKKHNEPIALGYVGFRVTEFAIIIVYLISPLLLMTLSQEYVKAGDPDAYHFQTLGTLFQAARYWAFRWFMSLMA